jgi:membrane protease YdiL (CAAX protease family)
MSADDLTPPAIHDVSNAGLIPPTPVHDFTSEFVPPPLPLPPPPARRSIAPIWHTIVLIAGILGFSIWGGIRASTGTEPLAALKGSRLGHYALSAVFELLLVGWVALGLRLRKVPFRSIFGALPRGLNNITMELGIAAAFWLCSMVVLASFGLTWNAVQTQIYKHDLSVHDQKQAQSEAQKKAGQTPTPVPPKPKTPIQQQTEMAHQLMGFAPSSGIEIAGWALLCLIVGFSEELVFRGYLQWQGSLLFRNLIVGAILSSLVFGGAHAYEGLRGMCLIGIYGALFATITLIRRNLFPGMIAHSWHDFLTGMLLALMRQTHMLDKLPTS